MAVNIPTTGVSGSGILTSLGVGSGIDINGLVSSLMTAEQVPLTLLQNQQSGDQTQISAFGSVSSALASLQSAAQALETTSTDGTFSSMSATAADTTVLGASAGAGAAAGVYNISVSKLASNQIVRSNAAYAATDTFDNGTLHITVGNATTDVAIGPANNTLAGIAQAINTAKAGVTATVLNDGTTNHLLLSSNTSGASGTIKVSVDQTGSGATQNLSDLAYAGSDTATMVQAQAGLNASLTINGTSITRPSNTITDAIGGVTLNLTGQGTTSLTVAADSSGTLAAVNAFASAYNSVVKTLNSVSSYDASSNTAQPLNGNAIVLQLQQGLPRIFSHAVGGIKGGLTTLADVGVSLQQDGTMTVNAAKLQSALSNPGNDVASLFGGTAAGSEGFAYQLDQFLNNFTSPTGAISAQTHGLTSAIQSLTQRETDMTNYLDRVKAQYTAEFTNMDATVSQLNSVQSFMTQQLQYQLVYASQRGF